MTTLRCATCGHENAEHVTLPLELREGYCAVPGCECEVFTESFLTTRSMEDLRAAAKEGLAELDQLITEGRVPNYVENFAKLHEYIDANELAGLCDSRSDWSIDEANIVQGLMDERIKAVYEQRKERGVMTEYKVSFTAFVSNAEGTERFARPGWLILECGEDEDVASYAAWDGDGLVDVDFIDPGNHFPSAANSDVLRGEGCRIEEGEQFFFAIITKIERTAPVQVQIDAVEPTPWHATLSGGE